MEVSQSDRLTLEIKDLEQSIARTNELLRGIETLGQSLIGQRAQSQIQDRIELKSKVIQIKTIRSTMIDEWIALQGKAIDMGQLEAIKSPAETLTFFSNQQIIAWYQKLERAAQGTRSPKLAQAFSEASSTVLQQTIARQNAISEAKAAQVACEELKINDAAQSALRSWIAVSNQPLPTGELTAGFVEPLLAKAYLDRFRHALRSVEVIGHCYRIFNRDRTQCHYLIGTQHQSFSNCLAAPHIREAVDNSTHIYLEVVQPRLKALKMAQLARLEGAFYPDIEVQLQGEIMHKQLHGLDKPHDPIRDPGALSAELLEISLEDAPYLFPHKFNSTENPTVCDFLGASLNREWSEGTLALYEHLIQVTKDDVPARNKDWMRSSIVPALENPETAAFFVGAGHLYGDTGLIKLITDAGWLVERMQPYPDLFLKKQAELKN